MKIFSSTPISVCSLHSSSTADSCCCWGARTADAALRRRSSSSLPQIFTVCAGENVGPASIHIRQRHGLSKRTPFPCNSHYSVKLLWLNKLHFQRSCRGQDAFRQGRQKQGLLQAVPGQLVILKCWVLLPASIFIGLQSNFDKFLAGQVQEEEGGQDRLLRPQEAGHPGQE